MQGETLASHPYTPRINEGGNFCGHYPFAPRLELKSPIKHPLDPELKRLRDTAWAYEDGDPAKPKGGIPLVLARLIERIPQYYSRPRGTIPSLDLANGSTRQQRSERREACICIMAAFLKYTDLSSLRVGIPTSGGFLNFTVKYLAKSTHMSLKRCERAIKDLKRAGLITVSQPRELQPDGSWRGLAAVKAVNKTLFEVFGLGGMLKKERDKASKRLKVKSDKWRRDSDGKPNRAGVARMSLLLGGATEEKPKPKPKSMAPPNPRAELDRKKLIANLAVKFKIEHPDWNSQKCHEAAEIEADRMALERAQA